MNHLFCPQSIVLFTVGAFHSLRNSANYVWGVNGTLIQCRAFYRKISGRSGTLNSYKGVPFSLWKFYLHCKWKRSVLALKLGPLRWVKYCDLTLLIRASTASTVQIPRADIYNFGQRGEHILMNRWTFPWKFPKLCKRKTPSKKLVCFKSQSVGTRADGRVTETI